MALTCIGPRRKLFFTAVSDILLGWRLVALEVVRWGPLLIRRKAVSCWIFGGGALLNPAWHWEIILGSCRASWAYVGPRYRLWCLAVKLHFSFRAGILTLCCQILPSQGHFYDMLTYFKFMLVSAEGLHRPPGARLKSAKGRGCHHVEIMLSYLDLRRFDYFWTAFCPTNQSRFKFSCVCVIFEIYLSPILEAPRHGRLMLDENHPMLIRCINMCIFFNMFAVCWKTRNFYPKRRPGDATLLFFVVLMFVLCEHLTPKYLLQGVTKLIYATIHNSFL